MTSIDVHVAGFHLAARLQTEAAPRSCTSFLGRRILWGGAQDVSFLAR